jgi:hypothetical protein
MQKVHQVVLKIGKATFATAEEAAKQAAESAINGKKTTSARNLNRKAKVVVDYVLGQAGRKETHDVSEGVELCPAIFSAFSCHPVFLNEQKLSCLFQLLCFQLVAAIVKRPEWKGLRQTHEYYMQYTSADIGDHSNENIIRLFSNDTLMLTAIAREVKSFMDETISSQ